MNLAIQVSNVSKFFRNEWTFRKKEIIHDISFEVQPGEIFGFIGPNGAGKTSTIKMLLDFVRPSSGKILLMGEPPGHKSARRKVGFMAEQPYFYEYLTAIETLELYGQLSGLSKRDACKKGSELLERVKLHEVKKKKLRNFSKGMLQRLGLAQALIAEPQLVILDEPMSGLDPIGRKMVKDMMIWLKEKGVTVFFSTHILSDVEAICDRVGMMNKGKLTVSIDPKSGVLEEEFLKQIGESFS